MAESNNNPVASQEQYTAGLIYNTRIDKGSSTNFGYAELDSGSQMSLDNLVVNSGTEVTFSAYPDTAAGFKFKAWYDPTTGSALRYPNPIRLSITSDTYLVPAFEPNAPTFKRPILVRVGSAGTTENLVVVSSMNDYYKYMLDSGDTLFNDSSAAHNQYQLPDGKKFNVFAREIDGYNITFKVDGSIIAPEVASSAEYQEEQEEQERGTQNKSVGETDILDYQFSTPTYKKITVNNPSGTTAKITVEVIYTPKTQRYTINLSNNPRSGGTVIGQIVGDESRTGISFTVDSGTQVKISATPAAGYNFTQWKCEQTGGTYDAPTAVVTVDRDMDWVAQFNQPNYTSITVQAQPTSGGTVNIIADGSVVSGNTVYSNQVSGRYVTLRASARTDYNFLYWIEASDPDTKYTSQDLEVTFGDYDLVYTAVFEYSPTGSVTFKAFTSVLNGTTINQVAGNDSVYFKTVFTRASGGTTTETIKNSVKDLSVLIQNDSNGYYSIIQLEENSPYIVTEGGRKYRYSLYKFLYAPTYPAGNSLTSWTECSRDSSGNWKLYYPGYDNKLTTHSLTGVFNKEEIYTVSVRNSTTGHVNGTTDILVSGGGEHLAGDSVTVTTSLKSGVDSNRYQFIGWFNGDIQLSTETSYTFTVSGSITLTAKYTEYGKLTYSASPSNLGTVTSDTPSGSWLPYGTQVTLTGTPVVGSSLVRWMSGSVQIAGAVGSVSITISTPNTTIVARFAETSKLLKVRISGSGTVTIELKDTEGIYSYTEPDTGTDDTYTVPSNYGVRATATPASRYTFSNFTLYNSDNGEVLDTSTARIFEITSMTGNRTLEAVFNYIPWISTLGTIIKVY